MRQLLDQAIDEYLEHRRHVGRSRGTIANDRQVLKGFLRSVGNIYCHSITEDHVERYWGESSQTREAGLHSTYFGLKGFFRWAKRKKRVAHNTDPMASIERPQPTVPEKARVPVQDFPRLLDACSHPRDRAVVAVGLELFLRGSEMRRIRIGDVDLGQSRIRVHVSKKRAPVSDRMPVSHRLDAELRSYLTYYANQQGDLSDHWYLLPAKEIQGGWDYDPATGCIRRHNQSAADPLKPEKPVRDTYEIAKRALSGIDFPIWDATKGKSAREGIHTLRRSGARALFDELCDNPECSDPLGVVKEMLHHETRAQTEDYIGVGLTRLQRDRMITGRRPCAPADNVVGLHRGENQGRASAM